MRRILCFFASAVICAVMLCVPSFAAEKASAWVVDDANAFSGSDEKTILQAATEAADATGFNIVVFTSDNVGSDKSDSAVTDFADLKYESLCGMNTDGILLFINFDNKYDRISTSGVCINYFSDARIDRIFDDIWDDLVDGNYAQAANSVSRTIPPGDSWRMVPRGSTNVICTAVTGKSPLRTVAPGKAPTMWTRSLRQWRAKSSRFFGGSAKSRQKICFRLLHPGHGQFMR